MHSFLMPTRIWRRCSCLRFWMALLVSSYGYWVLSVSTNLLQQVADIETPLTPPDQRSSPKSPIPPEARTSKPTFLFPPVPPASEHSLLPLQVLERYQQWHSQEALERQMENRRFAVAYYSCPLQAGNRLHHFYNSTYVIINVW